MISQDKIEHWAFGFVLTLFALVDPIFTFSGLVFAIGKESYDQFYGKGWDWLDLNATLIGTWTGLMFLVVISR